MSGSLALTHRTVARLIAAALVLGPAWPAPTAAAMDNRYVVIVANNRSLDQGVSHLQFADDDGARYYELFKLNSSRVALFTVMDAETARIFPDAARAARSPTLSEILGQLGRWNLEMARKKSQGQQTELFFIYAGHGDVDEGGEGFVNLLRSRLTRSDLYQKILAPSQASFTHLIIDACKSYFLVKKRGERWKDDNAPDTHEAEVKAFLKREDLSEYPRVGVILATSGDQSTHEWTRYRGGILSHELRSALTGTADINSDGRVEYSELYAFIAAANSRLRHPEVRLNVFVQPPLANRHRPLMDLREAGGARLLHFDRHLSGHYYLEDDRGVRYADMNKAPGVRFDMALDHRRSYFIHRKDQEARLAPGQQRVTVSSLKFSAKALAHRGSLDRSFRRDLYKISYSRGFYDGFCTQTGMVPVQGGSQEFVIARVRDPSSRGHRHKLMLGYLIGAALRDLSGVAHGVQLHYSYAPHPNIALGAVLEYAHSSHDATGDHVQLDRFAALAGVAARAQAFAPLWLRIELNLGYQGTFNSGAFMLEGFTLADGSNSMGFRLDAGLGARYMFNSYLFGDLRGGVSVSFISIEDENGGMKRFSDTAPFGVLNMGVTF